MELLRLEAFKKVYLRAFGHFAEGAEALERFDMRLADLGAGGADLLDGDVGLAVFRTILQVPCRSLAEA